MDQTGLLLINRLCFIIIPMVVIAAGAAASAASLPGCPSTCGDVDIPYPFGIGDGCYMPGFEVTCNETLMKAFSGNVEIINISVPLGQIRMLNQISWQCYNVTNNSIDHSTRYLSLEKTSYRFSDALNKFTVIGCYTLAYIYNNYQANDRPYLSGCVSMCENNQSLVNGTCSGTGCCQTFVPKDLDYYEVWFDEYFNTSSFWNLSDCSFAVMLEAKWFNYQTYYSTTTKFWYENNACVRNNQTCEIAQRNQTSYACVSGNSVCLNSSNGPGYLCNCSDGYQGNPYLKHGCQDIDECRPVNPCPNSGICHNLTGKYNCTCPPGTHGNPFNGPCTTDQKLPLAVKVVVGTSGGLAFAIFCSMCICLITERRKRTKDRERYFREHGGTSSVLAFIFCCSILICMVIQRRRHKEIRERYFRDHSGRLLLEEIEKTWSRIQDI